MPLLTIKPIPTYRCRQPVAFGEHRSVLRPRDSHDESWIEARRLIPPPPTNIRRARDAFDNHVDIARFAGRAKELRFDSTVRLDHSHADIHDLDIEELARSYPFIYGAEEMPVLARFVERQSVDPDCHGERSARTFLRNDLPPTTLAFLMNLTYGIKQTFKHT